LNNPHQGTIVFFLDKITVDEIAPCIEILYPHQGTILLVEKKKKMSLLVIFSLNLHRGTIEESLVKAVVNS